MGNECSIDSMKNLIPDIDLGDLNPTNSVPNSYIEEEDEEIIQQPNYLSKRILNDDQSIPTDNNGNKVDIPYYMAEKAQGFRDEDQQKFFLMDEKLGITNFTDAPKLPNHPVISSEVLRLKNGKEYYKGGWFRSMKHGYGKCVFEDKSIYEGYFKDDIPHGPGRLYTNKGDIFTGNFYEGQLDGKGKVIMRTGAVVEGNFEEDNFVGVGIKPIYLIYSYRNSSRWHSF